MQAQKPIIVVHDTFYVCEICHAHNHAVKLTCGLCGAIPPQYALSEDMHGKYSRWDDQLEQFIEVIPAHGCERQTRYKASRAYFRTVPMDYYAEPSNEKPAPGRSLRSLP